MVSLNTTANYSEQATRIWQDMLSGKLSFEQGRALFLALRQQQGDDATTAARIADALVGSAKEQREAGLASGAPWAQLTPQAASSTQTGPLTESEAGFLGEEPKLAFNRAFNLPSVGANPFQAYQRNQLAPIYSAYAGKNVLDLMSGQPGASFGSYLGASDLGAAPQRALSTLQSLGRSGAPTQQGFLEQFRGEDVGGSLPALFQAALQGRGYASPFARAGARQIPGLEEEFNTATLGGSRTSETGPLLSYLMKRLGLGG